MAQLPESLVNPIRKVWSQGRPFLSYWMHFNDPFVAEMLARCGFDGGVADMQHGLIDETQSLGLLRAMQGVPSHAPLVRVPSNDAALIGKMLDSGYAGIICPMINSKAEAEQFVAACYYPPNGLRSWGPTRAVVQHGVSLKDWHASLQPESEMTRPITWGMVETSEGVKNLDEILSVPLLDGILIGPMDLSLAMGEPCKGSAGTETAKAIDSIAAACRSAKKRIGIYCANADAAGKFVDAKFDFVVCAHDKVCLTTMATKAVEACRAKIGEAAKAGPDSLTSY